MVVAPLHAIRSRILAYYRSAPATLVYLFCLLVNWWTLRGADQRVTHRLIVSASTNLQNMREEPLQVLVASAFWTDSDGFPWILLIEFLVVLAAAERAIGTRSWIAIFAAGHVGATLITVTGVAYAVQHDMLPDRIAHVSDVGTSYGFFAVAAAFATTLPRALRFAASAGLIGYLVVAAYLGQTFTDYGHLIALAIGFVAYPIGRMVARRYRAGRIDRAGTAQREEVAR